jgi:uncharacterized protein (DUF362 family)
MPPSDIGITRRGLLTGIMGTAAAATLSGREGSAAEGAAARARVVRVESAKIWKGDKRDAQVVAEMVNRGMAAFAGTATADEAWKRFFKPGMRVGLKLNLLGRPLVFTAREMTDAVAAGVIAAGVKPGDVVVWDRHASHFGPTDYAPGPGRLGERIVTGGQYDNAKALIGTGGMAPIDRIATEQTDVTVNLPIMKDHQISGVTFALKNIAFGCYANHRSAHGGNCEPFISEAYGHYVKQTKVPLHILDATRCCYDQGPAPHNTDAIWNENAIYIAGDPVAMDAVCREVILQRRKAGGLSDTRSAARHIEAAAQKGLGVGDLARIDVVTVKV